ncbi:MAG: hypothetical protein ACRCX2_17945 [Paraclostridium sp.]
MIVNEDYNIINFDELYINLHQHGNCPYLLQDFKKIDTVDNHIVNYLEDKKIMSRDLISKVLFIECTFLNHTKTEGVCFRLFKNHYGYSYIVLLNSKLRRRDSILVHELTHVYQVEYNLYEINNSEVRRATEYRKQPWEIHAYNVQSEFVKVCFKSKVYKFFNQLSLLARFITF